ncbi:MAG: hypothetical protein ACLFP2_00450 [Candidatus Woesearchaeota archaeon]
MRYLLLFLLIPFAFADCSSLYVPQLSDNKLDIYYDLFLDSEVEIDELPSFDYGKPQCLDLPEHTNTAHQDISFWKAWQQYGAIRGYTYKEFVWHNLEKNGKAINPVNFDPFEKKYSEDPNTVDKYYMDKLFNDSYQQELLQANQNFLSNTLPGIYKDSYIMGRDSNQENELEALQDIELRFLVLDFSELESTSLSLASIADYSFDKVMKTSDKQILVVLALDSDKASVSVSFLEKSDSEFYDELIAYIEELLREHLSAQITFDELIEETRIFVVDNL